VLIVFDCAAVMFDCDGVLVDSGAVVEAAWTRWAGEIGIDPADVLPHVHGHRTADTVGALVPAADRGAALDLIDTLELEMAAATEPIPGAAALLAGRPSVPWAVVTSGTAALARARLAAAGLPIPDVVVTAEDVERGKPAPDPYLCGARRLGLDPARTVVVEDTPSGVAAARAAGVRAVIGVGERGIGGVVDARVGDLTGLQWVKDGIAAEPAA
jgi:sugar-phosphatase